MSGIHKKLLAELNEICYIMAVLPKSHKLSAPPLVPEDSKSMIYGDFFYKRVRVPKSEEARGWIKRVRAFAIAIPIDRH